MNADADDRKVFVGELAKLAEMYHQPLSDLLVTLYWDSLRDYRLDDVVAAMREAMRRDKRFPVAAALIERIERRVGQRRSEAEAEARRRRALRMSDEEWGRLQETASTALAEIRRRLEKQMIVPRRDAGAQPRATAAARGTPKAAAERRELAALAERKRKELARLAAHNQAQRLP